MTLGIRIRKKLDASDRLDFNKVVEAIIAEGVSDEELREILPDFVRSIAKQRSATPFLQNPVIHTAPADTQPVSPRPTVSVSTSSGRPAVLLPEAKPVFTPSEKIKGYQASRLDELYPVGSGKYKKLKEMNKEDIRFTVRMLEGKVKGLETRIKGWEKVLYQLDSYKVNIVGELPDNVKNAI